MRKVLLGSVAAFLMAGVLPTRADEAKPYAGQIITVLFPPWTTLPKDMTDRFTAQTGIKLDLQTLGWDDIRTKIVTSMVAGTAPADVTEVDWSWVGQFGAAQWYVPLDGDVDAAVKADLPTDSIFTFDGKLIALPYNNDYRLLILNEDHLKKAGIDHAPTTPDELMSDAKAIKAKGVVAYPIGLPFSATEGSATAWYLLTRAFGGELFDAASKPLFTSPDSPGYKALAWEMAALKDGLIDPAATGLKDVEIQELFKNGQITFDVAGWAGNLSVYTDPTKSKVAAAAQGALMPNVSGKTRTFGLPGAAGIPAASQHKEAAAVFVKWMVAPESQIESYTALGNLPTRTSVLQTLDQDGKLASGKVLLEQAATVEPLFKQGTPGWYPQFSSAVATALNQAAKGQLTVDAAIKQIAAGAEDAQK
ncbi:sugar ABC transporter substrate-binding protein [Lichenihabitans sp. Uapishka_5]|uniref:ABC transporter substrate-binding protein n=1 Tax=Lichenihabitans sp. Uapishka_5 TaxID=3037302 RepID=UPI0029E7E8B8|nr:sugar ABC transporter substrate-binding protein [Lichenihabitans sp. Uapishka_5]MDX7950803.1 sugar ABC transporter substrate-binding protein [Lichenihabitans sp. Uapishka_5]